MYIRTPASIAIEEATDFLGMAIKYRQGTSRDMPIRLTVDGEPVYCRYYGAPEPEFMGGMYVYIFLDAELDASFGPDTYYCVLLSDDGETITVVQNVLTSYSVQRLEAPTFVDFIVAGT